MRKKSTRLVSAALAVCMMLSALPMGAFAAEPGEAEQENGVSAQADPVDSEFVEINDTNFPDPAFLQYVKDNIDTVDTPSGQKDGKLSKAERDGVTGISINNKNCTDLTGIAYFANLTTLDCSDNKLTRLDMSGNPALSTLSCQHNELEELNLKDNANLTELNCSYNKLTTLDVSKNAKLSALRCYNNGMEELNLGDITHLTLLQCEDNNLTELDVSKNPYLKELVCRENKLRRVVIGKKYSLTTLYLRGNPLTSLDLSGTTREIWNLDNLWQLCAIDVNEDGKFDLNSLPEGFDEDKTSAWLGCTKSGSILTVNSHRVRYLYNTGSTYNKQKRMTVILTVNQHKYQWNYDDTKHWRTCELDYCSGLTADQEAKGPHTFASAKDAACADGCGYMRPLYTVTADSATAILGGEELNAPVAAGTEVTLTAGDAPEGKIFAGWKLYKVVNGAETEITNETELAKLLKNGTETTATLTMPAYNVKVEPYYSNIPYNITPVDCTVDKPEAAMGDTVTATRREPEANEHFTGWTVTVDGVEKDPSTFLTPDANDPAKVSFTMPNKDVEVKADFKEDPIEPIDPIGPSDTDYGGDIAAGVVIGGIAAVGAYEVGTGLYRITQMDDVAMPTNRLALAELLWERAGKPEPESTALYSDISAEDTDAQKAARWAVEQELLKDDTSEDEQKFHPAFPVSKLRVCLTWEKAKQKGLFDQNTEA